jgi:type II secretion system protein C
MLKLLLKIIPALTVLFAASLLDPAAYGGEKSYLVLGVIASGDGNNGVALLKSQASGSTFAVKVGHKVEPGVEVASIAREYVTFSVRGRLERIRVGEESGSESIPVPVVNVDQITEGIEAKGEKVRITSSLRDTLTGQQLSRVLVQAAALPYYEDGQLSGFKLMAIDAGSIYDKVGFKDGDIVTSVNGQRLSDVGRTIQLLHSLKGANMAQVTYRRGGADRSLTLEVQ